MVGIEVAVMTGTVTSMPSLVNMKYMWVKNAFSILVRLTRSKQAFFGGNLLAHILVKLKYVLNSYSKALIAITLMNVEFESIKALIDFPLT
jgi:DNA/RNA endonuclease YhcR with UshA esterase domain